MNALNAHLELIHLLEQVNALLVLLELIPKKENLNVHLAPKELMLAIQAQKVVMNAHLVLILF